VSVLLQLRDSDPDEETRHVGDQGGGPGVQLPDGRRIDASAFGEDYGEAFFGGDGLERLARWVASGVRPEDFASVP
jgi:hypothetical protein